MRNVNRVIIAGNLTHDPEFRTLPSDTPVVNFSLAANRRWKDRNGETQEETTFVDCEAFGRQAEVLRDYASKGRGLFVEGRLRLDQWQNREGQNRSKIKIVVDHFQFTDARDAAGSTDEPSEPTEQDERKGESQATSAAGQRRSDSHREPVTDADDVLPF